MHYKTTYILNLFERQIYFQSEYIEDEEDAANRFFNMRNNQMNKRAQATPFFEVNTDLHFSAELSLKEKVSARGREYILNSSGGLTAKFYDFLLGQWRILYQGSWLSFVNQFATLSEPLYGFKLSETDSKERFLTLPEAKLLALNLRVQALMFKEPARLRLDANFLESQIDTLKKEAKK
jgi:hypothetical protein